MKLTAEFIPVEDGWWFVRCPEVESALSQGRDLEEARYMIRLMLEEDPERAGQEFEIHEIVREAPCGSS